MKKFKLIIKGVLLYVTTLVTLLYMMGIDSIYDNGYFIHGLILVLILIGVCYKTINKEELEILTLNKYLNKTTRNTGYFLGNYSTSCGPVVDTCNGVGVY